MKEFNDNANASTHAKLMLLSEIAALAMKNEFPTDEVAKNKYKKNLLDLLENRDQLVKKEGEFLDNFIIATIETIDTGTLNKDSLTKLLEQHELDSSIKFLKDISKAKFLIKTHNKEKYFICGNGTYAPIENDEIRVILMNNDTNVEQTFSSKSQEIVNKKLSKISEFFSNKFGVSEYYIGTLRTLFSRQSYLLHNLVNLQPDNNGVVNYSLEYDGDADLKYTINIDLSQYNVVKIYYTDIKGRKVLPINKSEEEVDQENKAKENEAKAHLARTIPQDKAPNPHASVKNNPTTSPTILDIIAAALARIYHYLFSSKKIIQDQPSIPETNKEVKASPILPELAIEAIHVLSPVRELDTNTNTPPNETSFTSAEDDRRQSLDKGPPGASKSNSL